MDKDQLVVGKVEIDMNRLNIRKDHTNSPIQHLNSADFLTWIITE